MLVEARPSELESGLDLPQLVWLQWCELRLEIRLFSGMGEVSFKSGSEFRTLFPSLSSAARWSRETVLLTELLAMRKLRQRGHREEDVEEMEEELDLRDSRSLVGLRGGRGGGGESEGNGSCSCIGEIFLAGGGGGGGVTSSGSSGMVML